MLANCLTRGERPKPSPCPARRATSAHQLTQRAVSCHNPERPTQATTKNTLYGNCVAAAPDTHSPTPSTLRCVPRAYNDSACHAALRGVRSSRYPTHHTQPYIDAIRCSRIASPSQCAPRASGPGDSGAYRWHSRCSMEGDITRTHTQRPAPRVWCEAHRAPIAHRSFPPSILLRSVTCVCRRQLRERPQLPAPAGSCGPKLRTEGGKICLRDMLEGYA